MKLNDKVVLKKGLIVGKTYGGLTFFRGMACLNSPRKIVFIDHDDGSIRVECSPYWYSIEMLKKV